MVCRDHTVEKPAQMAAVEALRWNWPRVVIVVVFTVAAGTTYVTSSVVVLAQVFLEVEVG